MKKLTIQEQLEMMTEMNPNWYTQIGVTVVEAQVSKLTLNIDCIIKIDIL